MGTARRTSHDHLLGTSAQRTRCRSPAGSSIEMLHSCSLHDGAMAALRSAHITVLRTQVTASAVHTKDTYRLQPCTQTGATAVHSTAVQAVCKRVCSIERIADTVRGLHTHAAHTSHTSRQMPPDQASDHTPPPLALPGAVAQRAARDHDRARSAHSIYSYSARLYSVRSHCTYSLTHTLLQGPVTTRTRKSVERRPRGVSRAQATNKQEHASGEQRSNPGRHVPASLPPRLHPCTLHAAQRNGGLTPPLSHPTALNVRVSRVALTPPLAPLPLRYWSSWARPLAWALRSKGPSRSSRAPSAQACSTTCT